MRQSLATHTSIAELIKERTDSTQFLEFLQTEQDLVNNQNVHRYLDFIEDAACQDVELLRVFRVMCVQSIIGSGLKPKVLDAYRKMILQVYGHRHLLSLINLEKAGLLTSQGIERAKIPYSNLLSIILIKYTKNAMLQPFCDTCFCFVQVQVQVEILPTTQYCEDA